jgi:hypothetical protein
MFLNRGKCGACALRGDIVVDIMFLHYHYEKRRARRH